MSLLDDGSTELIARIGTTLIERFGPMVCPIGAEWNGRTLQCGTGTLFRIGERHFLITAAHVLTTINKAGAAAFTGDYAPPDQIVPRISIQGFHVVLIAGEHDVALIELPKWFVAKIPHRRFMTMLDFAFDEPRSGDEYFVFGFPSEMSDLELQCKDRAVFNQSAILFPTNCEPVGERLLENFDHKKHLLFAMPAERVTDKSGSPMPTSLDGISGSAIWRVLRGQTSGFFDVEAVKMIAIENHVYKRAGLIKGTIWGAILVMLWVQFEDIRPSMQCHLPPRDIEAFRRFAK